jgi:hypothetical protein
MLLEFPTYCWSANETFKADMKIANYSNTDLTNHITWKISQEDGKVLKQGSFTGLKIMKGGLRTVGKIQADVSSVKKACKLTVSCSVSGTDYKNVYPIWVYPSDNSAKNPGDIIVTEKLNNDILNSLQKGAKVLYFPQTGDVKNNSFPGLFPPDFWNYGMFKGISEWAGKPVSPGTLGLLMDPEHPVFNDFPTDFHTNWQWFSIVKAGNSLILDNTPSGYFPIVQVIDNLERNHKLGFIFEFKVGSGKLLVCMSQLNRITGKPEARQLYQSIMNYMESDTFNPEYELNPDKLRELFQ